MADVTDRAQLILVSGLLIAVTLLVLVLLLNTVIYTENVATRGIDSDLGDAGGYQLVMDEEVERLLEREHEEGANEWTNLEERVESLISLIGDQQAELALLRGHVSTLSAELTPGVVINDADFDNAVIKNADELETFVLTVDPGELDNDDNVDVSAGDWGVFLQGTSEGLRIEDNTGTTCEINDVDQVDIYFVSDEVDPEPTGECPNFFQPDGTPPETADPFDLDIVGDIETIEAVDVQAIGPELSSEQEGATWYTHRADLTLSYRSQELEYETIRKVSGARP